MSQLELYIKIEN